MDPKDITHFTGKKWECRHTPEEWKDIIDNSRESGYNMTPLEMELYQDYVAMSEIARFNPRADLLLQYETRSREAEAMSERFRRKLFGIVTTLECLAKQGREVLRIPTANDEDDRCDSDPKKKGT